MSTDTNKKPNNQKAGCIGCFTIIILIIVVTAVVTYFEDQSKYTYTPMAVDAPEYKILEREDLSLGKYIRISYQVSINHSYTKEDLKKIALSIVETQKGKEATSAVGITFFSKKLDPVTKENIVKAVIDWAPNSKWGNAMDIEPGNYNTHEFSYDFYTHIDGNF